MGKRRRYNNNSRLGPWIGFVMFALTAAFLGYSAFTKQNPATVIKELFTSEASRDPILRLNKAELRDLVNTQSTKIDSLNRALNVCLNDDGLRTAIISTTADALNMRDEPSLNSEIILKIPNGNKVGILYFDQEELFLDGAMGRWAKIRYADKEGWVWGNYLEE